MKQEDIFLQPLFEPALASRHKAGSALQKVFTFSTAFGIFVLALLLLTIVNDSFGYAAVTNNIDPATLVVDGVPFLDQTPDQLQTIIKANLTKGKVRGLEKEKPLADRSQADLAKLVSELVVEPKVDGTWTLIDSLLHKTQIEQEVAAKYPGAILQFNSWLNLDFFSRAASSDPLRAGVRTALFGSLWTIAITILFAFPIGVGAAIFLEEYTVDNAFYRLLKTNITNLAGVPSIIYGMLGLAIFVRGMQPITSGAIFGGVEGDPAAATGRTILSAGLTLSLLVLPLIIINAQEAIRAVSPLLRQASLGLGATQWETIWHHVLPEAMPGILTGTILAISRAIGETAPLVVVGAATFITFDPSGPFSKFTTLPIQIYQWVARPQSEFRSLAAAAILVLMAMLLGLNAVAIYFRNRLQKRY
jgi:phosphate transport system permease protein